MFFFIHYNKIYIYLAKYRSQESFARVSFKKHTRQRFIKVETFYYFFLLRWGLELVSYRSVMFIGVWYVFCSWRWCKSVIICFLTPTSFTRLCVMLLSLLRSVFGQVVQLFVWCQEVVESCNTFCPLIRV